MGPFASLKMYEVLLVMARDKFKAKDDESFPEIIIDSVPVPDFISNTKTLNVVRKTLVSRVKKLNQSGVGVLGMVCNTAHVLHSDLSKASGVEFLSMIELVSKTAMEKGFRRVGILATPTTIKSDLYGQAMSKFGIEVVYPHKDIRRLLERIIRKAVKGKRDEILIKSLEMFSRNFLLSCKLDGLILGCTELPLVFPKDKFKGKVIDSIEVLADALLVRYYNEVNN